MERFYPEFEAVYEERYQERYGFPGPPEPWRRRAIEPFLKFREQEVFALLLREGKTCLPAGRLPRTLWSEPICCPKCGAEMKILAFIACLPKPRRRQERHQNEVIEKLRCAKRTSILGKLTGRAWEAHSPALRTVGREPGARLALGADPGYGLRLNSRGTRERWRRA